MISFIISSTFKTPFVGKQIEIILKEMSSSDELILINQTTFNLDKLKSDNVKVVSTGGREIGKNEAWNLGFNRASKRLICFIDDDIIFNVYAFIESVKKMDLNNIGIVGLNPNAFNTSGINALSDSIGLEKCDSLQKGFDSILLMNKSNYYKMPMGMIHGHGASLLFFYIKSCLKKTPHCFTGFKVMTMADKLDKQVASNAADKQLYQKELEKLTTKYMLF